MDPKVRVVASTALYGTVGGALLGTASLAFGAKGRAVAIGASVGLYAGLIFGSYVVVTHQMQKNRYQNPETPLPPQDNNYYPQGDEVTPYKPGTEGSGLFDGFFQRSITLHELSAYDSRRRGEYDRMLTRGPEEHVFSMDLVRFQF